jgi:hypothetical protein
MREIKFRAWDSNFGRWLDVNGSVSPGVFWEHGRLVPIQDYIVLSQFTGLYDRDGKEIYEGDIVSWRSCIFASDVPLAAVEWRQSHCAFRYSHSQASYDGQIWDQELSHCEIIGNIYENPELLESQEKDVTVRSEAA